MKCRIFLAIAVATAIVLIGCRGFDSPFPTISLTLEGGSAEIVFADLNVGYGEEDIQAQTVTVTNHGHRITGVMRVTAENTPGAENFIVSPVSTPRIVPGGTMTFTVEPVLGLAAGSHSVNIIVSGGGVTEEIEFSAEVTVVAVGTGLRQLERPEIRIMGSMVIWDAVPEAGGYRLMINGTGVAGGNLGRNERSFNLAGLPLSQGSHTVTLIAVGVPGYSRDSLPSAGVPYVVASTAQPGLPQLDAPIITLTSSVVSWTSIATAAGYSLRIDGIEAVGGDLPPGSTNFNLADLGLPEGDHTVTLIALGADGQSLNSPPSNEVPYTIATAPLPGLLQLDTPRITLDGFMVSWDGVAGASGYSLRVRSFPDPISVIAASETSFNLAGLNLPAGIHVITLVALGVPGVSLNSQASNAVTLAIVTTGGANITITLPDFRDLAGDIHILGSVFSMLGTPAYITFDSQSYNVDSVEWFVGGSPAPATAVSTIGTQHTITLDSSIHGNMEGNLFVTLEVVINNIRYSQIIVCMVTL